MKKIFFIFYIFISCYSCENLNEVKKEKIKKDPVQILKEKINNILYSKAVSLQNKSSIIIGKWNALTIGEVLKSNNHSLPSTFIFRDNNSYEYSVMISGIRFESTGTVNFNFEKNPIEFTLFQNYPRSRVYHGIIDFVSETIFRTIFYAEDFSPRPSEFIKRNIQIFEKEN